MGQIKRDKVKRVEARREQGGRMEWRKKRIANRGKEERVEVEGGGKEQVRDDSKADD